MLTIRKVLNVNVIIAVNEQGQESILLGSGIGFGGKPGMAVDEKRIERKFSPADNEEKEKLLRLISAIPREYFRITEEIVRYAKENYSFEVGESVYIVLPDHLHFAVERFRSDMIIPNRVDWEIKSFYPDEYKIGMYGLELLEKQTGIRLPDGEASNIAFHIINLRYDRNHGGEFESMRAVKIITAIMSIIKYSMKAEPNTDSNAYVRFITHMQYFTKRFFSHTLMDSDTLLYPYLEEHCENALVLPTVKRIDRYFRNEYNTALPKEELAYFGIHLERMFRSRI